MRFAKQYLGITSEQLETIISAGGGLQPGRTRQEIREAFEDEVLAGQLHAGRRQWQKAPAPKADDFAKVARTAERLLKLLGVPKDGRPHVRPTLRGGSLNGLNGQGHAWAGRWFKAANRETKVAIVRRSRERRLLEQGRYAEAKAVRAAREVRRKDREKMRDRWHRLHGRWPSDTSPQVIQTREGDRFLVYGEDLAIIAAVEGVQRLRTWADLEARRLQKNPALAVRPEPIDGPLRTTPTIVIGRLAANYPRLFGRRLQIVKDGGLVYGTGIEYLRACLEVLGISMEPAAIEIALRRYRSSQGTRRS